MKLLVVSALSHVCMQRYQTYLGLTAGGVPSGEAMTQANNAVNNLQGLSEGLVTPGTTPVTTLLPIYTPAPTPASTPAAAPVVTLPPVVGGVTTPVASNIAAALTPVPSDAPVSSGLIPPFTLPTLTPIATLAVTPSPIPEATPFPTAFLLPSGSDVAVSSPLPDLAAPAAPDQAPAIPSAYPTRAGRKISQVHPLGSLFYVFASPLPCTPVSNAFRHAAHLAWNKLVRTPITPCCY
jgi:hypothetical protein